MCALRQTRRFLRLPVVRLMAGALVTAICFHWGSRQDLQQWLFPFLFATGILTTCATGPRWGWLVAPSYLVVQGSFTIANAIRGPLDWFYHGNLLTAVLGQSETIVITAAFALVAGMGGLCGWVTIALISSLMPNGAGWSAHPNRETRS